MARCSSVAPAAGVCADCALDWNGAEAVMISARRAARQTKPLLPVGIRKETLLIPPHFTQNLGYQNYVLARIHVVLGIDRSTLSLRNTKSVEEYQLHNYYGAHPRVGNWWHDRDVPAHRRRDAPAAPGIRSGTF